MGLFSNGFEKILTHIVEIYGVKFNCSKTEGSFFKQNITFHNLRLEHVGQHIQVPMLSIYKKDNRTYVDIVASSGTCQIVLSENDVQATGITIDIINEICPNDYRLDNMMFSYDYLRSKALLGPNQYISLSELNPLVKTRLLREALLM